MKTIVAICIYSTFAIYVAASTPRKFNNLALEGGGTQAISYIGALLALKDTGYYKDDGYTFDQIGGSSTGCLVGLLVSLDIPPVKLEKLIYKLNIFKHTVNFDTGLFDEMPEKASTYMWITSILKTFNLISKTQTLLDLWLDSDSPGLSTEDTLLRLLNEIILPLSPHRDLIENLKSITFLDLKHITNHELRCFSTQLNDMVIYEFSVSRTPDEYVTKAVYASMTLPGIFKPLSDGQGNTLIDGGFLYNFPITMNDRQSVVDHTTLGISLKAKPELRQSLTPKQTALIIPDQKFKFKNLSTIDYIGSIYSLIINREAMFYSQNTANENRIVYLESQINVIETNIDANCISLAINKAYLNTLTFIKDNARY
uniref:Patatin-like phospholipase-like protein n=1 Tax=Oryctes rhinoceros nudivirus TaxID=92521 RepID=A3QTZ2_9VIRU|nr:putative patatin-like phospholipase [Oryctes rhinoceros nudivirus]QHG11294.1 patatin-like phospholipase-like protein [Oryctes rhinoceros nudivirus]UBR58237.1 patatin-like phospholipase-like protein [Oryctes rhinoceros nudivirus]WDA64505.1 patatin-like phospholipase-like protein [Oryctes rhinoceros nudivirus]WDA64876.1 patatin-like phospholipase-like protein [Oryctes rhinoceros nudivirus]